MDCTGTVRFSSFPTGAPNHQFSVDEIVSKACKEAEIYRDCGLHGVMVENMHDVPFLQNRAGPEVTACMARVASEVRRVAKGMLLGVQILSCEHLVKGNR